VLSKKVSVRRRRRRRHQTHMDSPAVVFRVEPGRVPPPATPRSHRAEPSRTKPRADPVRCSRASEAPRGTQSFCRANRKLNRGPRHAPGSAHLRRSVWWMPSPGEGRSGSRSARSSGCGRLRCRWGCGPGSRSPGSACEAVGTQGKKNQLEGDGTARLSHVPGRFNSRLLLQPRRRAQGRRAAAEGDEGQGAHPAELLGRRAPTAAGTWSSPERCLSGTKAERPALSHHRSRQAPSPNSPASSPDRPCRCESAGCSTKPE